MLFSPQDLFQPVLEESRKLINVMYYFQIIGTSSKSLRRILIQRSWMLSPGENTSQKTPQFQLEASDTQTVTARFLAHLPSLLVKREEDVITGKPEASNTFLRKCKLIKL